MKNFYKIVITGNSGTGKTSLAKQFCNLDHIENQKLTIGLDVYIKQVKVGSEMIKLQIWDLGGQDQFRFLVKDFFKGSTGAILAFNMRNRRSFLDIPIVLIATKKDLGYHLALNPVIVENFVRENDLINYTETSYAEKYNIEKPFELLLKKILNIDNREIVFISNLQL
jgi:small GTP-binding protein